MTMRKILLLTLIFLLFSFISSGQNNSYEYLDTLVTNYVKELQSQNIDTICIYKDYCVGCVYPINDEIDRCAYLYIREQSYPLCSDLYLMA
jgi:hypothetical protein